MGAHTTEIVLNPCNHLALYLTTCIKHFSHEAVKFELARFLLNTHRHGLYQKKKNLMLNNKETISFAVTDTKFWLQKIVLHRENHLVVIVRTVLSIFQHFQPGITKEESGVDECPTDLPEGGFVG